MLRNDSVSADAFVRLGNELKNNFNSNVMVSNVACSKDIDGFEFKLHYGLPDISGYAPNLSAFAKTIPFRLSFLAEFTGADAFVEGDSNEYSNFVVVTLNENFFRNFWRHSNFGKTPVIDLNYEKEGILFSKMTLKDLSKLEEPYRPVNVVYFPTTDGRGTSNLALHPCLNSDDIVGYTYVRTSKFISKQDFTFDGAPLVVLCEVCDKVGQHNNSHEYLVYIPGVPCSICVMSAEEIMTNNANFFITNGSIYRDAKHSLVIVGSGKPFPILEVTTKDSIYDKPTWIPPKEDFIIDEDEDDVDVDTEWLETLLKLKKSDASSLSDNADSEDDDYDSSYDDASVRGLFL